ncbi:MAG: hypothetical protein Fur0019_13000 [Tibeticola sp.]
MARAYARGLALSLALSLRMPMNHEFHVTGMTCGHCEKAVERAIKRVDPSARVQIDRAAERVQVQSEAAREALAQAIADEGYGVAA